MQQTQIVIGVLCQKQQVLISRRQSHQSYAGYWEFPGGKVEQGETFEQALTREFNEEVGVNVSCWQSLIQIPWQYEHANVMLNVFVADEFKGVVCANEGQEIKWVKTPQLADYQFPEANSGIINALILPDSCAITGGFNYIEDGLNILKNTLESGVKLVQLRAKSMSDQEFIAFAEPAIRLVHQYDAKVLLNAMPEMLQKLPNADGLQLASTATKNIDSRPIPKDKLLSISTHSQAEIEKAIALNADIILLSPVKKTSSHPELEGIGWQKFQQMATNIPVPVYALGGMKVTDINDAKNHGAQGIAAISSFWKKTIKKQLNNN